MKIINTTTSSSLGVKGREPVSPPTNRGLEPSASAEPATVSLDTTLAPAAAVTVVTAIGKEILCHHERTKKAALDCVVTAAKCGLLFLAAKEIIEEGKFSKWCEDTGFPFEKMTRCKYMRFSEHLCVEGKIKRSSLLRIESDQKGQSARFIYDEVALQKLITAVCEGRTLTDMYLKYNIVRRPDNNGQLMQGQRTEGSKLFGRCVNTIETIQQQFHTFNGDQKTNLVAKLKHLLTQLEALRSQKPAVTN